MAQIAIIAEGSVVGDKLFFTRAAGTVEAASQGKAMGKRPSDLAGSFQREKIRTAHGDFILVLQRSIV
jgi:hypothetical protein